MNNINEIKLTLENSFLSAMSALPKNFDKDNFINAVCYGITNHRESERLLNADKKTLFTACLNAAMDGLMLDNREAALVVFRDRKKNVDTVSYMPMVAGMIKLARDSGKIKNIMAEVVFQKDEFNYTLGHDLQPVHKPNWFCDRGAPIGVYSVVTTTDDEKIVKVLDYKNIKAIGNISQHPEHYDPSKNPFFAEFWKKAAIKNALKHGPRSSLLQAAMDADNKQYDFNKKQKATTLIESLSDAATKHKEKVKEVLSNTNMGMVASSVTIKDEETKKMIVDSIKSCNTIEELTKCGEDIKGHVHPEYEAIIKDVYVNKRKELKEIAKNNPAQA